MTIAATPYDVPMTQHHLRPIERTVLKRVDEGMTTADIAWRLRRSPGHVRRIIDLTDLPRDASSFSSDDGVLRPIERRVLAARRDGIDRSETAARLRRSPEFVTRVEELADYKLAGAGAS